jgi:hypothetical protein
VPFDHQSMDGLMWAQEFCRVTGFHDEEWAHTWFANAIMAGYDEATRRAAPTSSDEWRPSEALFAFGGWLTSRRERLVCSATDDAAPMADAIAEFCKRQNLSQPREGWHTVIKRSGDRA